MKIQNQKVNYFIITISIVLGIIFLDQLTKKLVVDNIGYLENIKIIPKFFYLEYIQNQGAAWGMFAGNDFVILVVPAIASLLFVYLLTKGNFKNKKLYSLGLILILGGTIGNYIDRLFLGYVVDFLSFRFGSYHYPNFNVADSSLVIGVILFAIDILFIEGKKEKRSEKVDEL